MNIRILALMALSLTACKSSASDAAPPGKGGGRKGLSFAADVMPVESKQVTYLVTEPGTIDAFERVQVTARVAGAVDRVGFAEGQDVKKGDTLVVIDSERFRVAVSSAKAALEKADASVKDAEAQVARREGATEKNPGLITGEELATYKTKAATARADRQVAAEALRTAQLNLRDSSVKAPIEGIIQTRTIETGQYVPAGYVMATLLRRDPLLLRFQVEPGDAPRLKPGLTVTFTMRETQRQFSAVLTLVSGAADPTTHMVPITAQVTEDDHKYWLRPGSFCDVAVDLSPQRSAPLIPRLAARATDHGYVAYVVEGDVAKERALTLGMSTKDGWVEVRSGLAAGDLLVVRGAEALSNGAKVRVNRVTPESLNAMPDGGAPPAEAASGAPAEAASGAPAGSGRRRSKAAPAASGEGAAP